MRIVHFMPGVVGAVALLATAGQGFQAPKAEKPDIIVTDLSPDGDELLLELQNQGPGTAKKGLTIDAVFKGQTETKVKDKASGKDKTIFTPFSLTIPVPVPAEPFAIEKVKVSLDKFSVKGETKLSPLVTVMLDPKKTLEEERPGNNTFHRQLDFSGTLEKPRRGDYRTSTELPDLVITDIVYERGYLFTHFKNVGKGTTGADFLIEYRSGKNKFEGNPYYRFQIPPPGEEAKSGGLTPGAIGLKPGDEVEVEAIIDAEDRVRETDKKNNAFKKKVMIPNPKKK